MIIKAKFEKGVFIPEEELDLKDGEEVEIIVKPRIGKWVGVLKDLESKSSVGLQHEIKDIWSDNYVSN